MSKANGHPHVWELAADDVLAVVYAEQNALEQAAFDSSLQPEHMPTEAHRAAYRAIIQLRTAGEPVHDTTVLEYSGGKVTLDWLLQRVSLYDPTRTGDVFLENVRLVYRHGEKHLKIQRLRRALEDLQRTSDDEPVITELLAELTQSSKGAIKGETAGEHGRDFRAYMNQEPDKLMTTGIRWLDDLTGGITQRRLWWIGGAYKSRKTTFALNIMLSSLLVNPLLSVAMLSKEVPAEDINAQLVAMLATAYMKDKGLYRATDTLISAENLKLARKRYRAWGEPYVEAVDWAIDTYWKLEKRFRVYDASPERGGLSDHASIKRVVSRDMGLYGGSLYFLDYLQLFDAPGNGIFERVSYLSRMLQTITLSNPITMFVLAQLNEATVQSAQDNYSPGVKGGGDPAQTANYFLTTHYKQGQFDEDDHKLPVNMRLSKHGRGGAKVRETLDIHPASGLVLDCNWIKGISKQVIF